MRTMVPVYPFEETVAIPQSANTLAGFRTWYASPEFPERGRIEFCDGEVLVDMSPERVESHAAVKGEIYAALRAFVRDRDLGEVFPDGPAFIHEAANFLTEPDAMFIRWESFRDGRVHGGLPHDEPLGFVGQVDWILEVVSPSSVGKDRKRKFAIYADAGVEEYWLVDARGEDIDFRIYTMTPEGYRLEPETDGFRASKVFGASFRLERCRNPRGAWRYSLQHR